MKGANFYVIELLEDVSKYYNEYDYRKGERKMVFEISSGYFIVNSDMEMISKESAKIVYNINFEEVEE